MRRRRILNTRAHQQSAALTSLLEAEGATVEHLPCLELQPSENLSEIVSALTQLSADDWVIFTSANGVHPISPLFDLTTVRVATIGEKTSRVLRDLGIKPTFVGSGASSEDFAEEFLSSLTRSASSTRVVLLRGDLASEVLPQRLSREGLFVAKYEVYRSGLPKLSAAEMELVAALSRRELQFDLLLFASSQTVKNFVTLGVEVLGDADFITHVGSIPVAVLGDKTALIARELGFHVVAVAETNSIESLVASVRQFLT